MERESGLVDLFELSPKVGGALAEELLEVGLGGVSGQVGKVQLYGDRQYCN